MKVGAFFFWCVPCSHVWVPVQHHQGLMKAFRCLPCTSGKNWHLSWRTYFAEVATGLVLLPLHRSTVLLLGSLLLGTRAWGYFLSLLFHGVTNLLDQCVVFSYIYFILPLFSLLKLSVWIPRSTIKYFCLVTTGLILFHSSYRCWLQWIRWDFS